MYLTFAKVAFQSRLAYRAQVWAQILGEGVQVLAKVAIWTAVLGASASASSSVDGITLPDMLTYAVLGGSLLSAWAWAEMMQDVGAQIRSGDVTVFLLRPLYWPLMILAGEIGRAAFRLLFVVLPVIVTAALVYGLTPPATLGHGLLFILLWLNGFAILFLLALLGSILAFWLLTAFSMEWLLAALLSILSGAFIPLWFYPSSWAAVIRLLPFAWVGFHPMAAYLGKATISEALGLLAMGLGWVAVLAGAALRLWHLAARRITVQGG